MKASSLLKGVAILVTIALVFFGTLQKDDAKLNKRISDLESKTNKIENALVVIQNNQFSQEKLEKIINKSVKQALIEWELNSLKEKRINK